jgi:hypothetical protein
VWSHAGETVAPPPLAPATTVPVAGVRARAMTWVWLPAEGVWKSRTHTGKATRAFPENWTCPTTCTALPSSGNRRRMTLPAALCPHSTAIAKNSIRSPSNA